MQVIPRIRLFICKLEQQALPTSSRLGAHNSAIDPHCQMCNYQEQETEQHLFILCPFARVIWFDFSLEAINIRSSTSSVNEWIGGWLSDPDFVQFSGKIATIMWFIWKHRCSVVFEKINPDPVNLMDHINRYLNCIPTKFIQNGISQNKGTLVRNS